MGKFKHMLLCAVACSLIVGGPAQAGCWGGSEVAASKVRALQTMLMVAALKCRASGIDISAPYNAFIAARRDVLEAANGAIRQHYTDAGAGQPGYDRFATVLANAYSAGAVTSAETCGQAAQLALDAANGEADLIRVSEQRVAAPALPEGVCGELAGSLAAGRPDAGQPPAAARTLLASAEPATAAAEAIPPEVAAAMAIVAAYARDHGAMVPAAAGSATAMVGALP